MLFGTAGLFAVTTGVGPMLITFGRTFFAAITLVLIMVVLRQRSSFRVDVKSIASGVLLAAHWSLFFLSIQLSNVAVGLIMFSVSAVFIALLEPVLFREPFRRIDVACALVVVVGIAIIAGTDNEGEQLTLGILIGLVSSLLFALLQLLNRSLLTQHAAVPLSMIQNAVASLVLLPLVITQLAAVTGGQWLQLLFLGCVCTALAHTLFISALRHVRASVAGLISGGMEPVYGAVLAALLLAQYPAMPVWLGGAVVIVAVVWAQAGKPR